jgi:hypothetical protein
MHSHSKRTWATNGLFGAFVLALCGSGLLHAWVVQAGAARSLHLPIAVPGLAICAIVLNRYARHWPARPVPLYREKRRGLAPATAAAGELLFVAGGGIALALSVDSALLLAPVALVLAVLPWTRLPFCRDHFFVAAAAVFTAAALGLAVGGARIRPPDYALGGLVCLCIAALITVFVVMAHGSRRDRMPGTGFGWMSD